VPPLRLQPAAQRGLPNGALFASDGRHALMIVVPIAAFFSLLARFALSDDDLRAAFVRAAVVWGAALVVITESLSLVSGIAAGPLLWSWLAVALIAYPWRRRLILHAPRQVPIALAAPTIVILLVTCALALLAASNTDDSMTYHLGRVMHWIQAGDLRPYPTNIHRQLYLGVWAESAILHLQILSGGSDRFANMVQWWAFLGCMVAASLAASRLGGSRHAQWIAALLVATTPELIAQATSTQTDLVCAFWLVCFLSLLLERDRAPWAAVAVGLAVATKPTAYAFAAPFLVMHALRQLKREGLRQAARELAWVGVAVIALNAGQFMRNTAVFDNPLGDGTHLRMVRNERYGPGVLVANVAKNVSLHLGTPFGAANRALTSGLSLAIRGVRQDPNDPATTVFGSFEVPAMNTHEDSAGNLLLVLLMLATCVGMTHLDPQTRPVFIGVVAGFVLFCFLFKWQPWNTRLQTPTFALAAVPTAMFVSRYLRDARRTVAVAIVFFAAALPWVVVNASRPLISLPNVGSVLTTPRIDQYFANRPDLREPLREAADQIRKSGCRQIGILTHENGWEYPMWQLTRDISPHFEQLFTDLDRLRREEWEPCLLVLIEYPPPGSAPDLSDWREVWSTTKARLFAPGHS
jgi:hypothetical protein